MPKKKGRKPKLYLVLDCETATLPFIKNWECTAKQRQQLSIAKPLIYDLGWQIIDAKGNIYSRHSFLIQETFFVPQVFNTAYYAWKRPLYMERYDKGEIICKTWAEATAILEMDLERADISLAYNAMFDFKKAIPFTERYINALYSPHYQEWEDKQRVSCQKIVAGYKYENPNEFDPHNFEFRDYKYPIADLWGLSCNRLINKDKYRINCIKESMISASGLYFKTSAESTFRFLIKNNGFEEEHTALSDSQIESEILVKILRKGKIDTGIEYFPFRELGYTTDYVTSQPPKKMTYDMVDNIIQIMYEKLGEYDRQSSFASNLETNLIRLELWLQNNHGKMHEEVFKDCKVSQLQKQLRRKMNYATSLNSDGKAYDRCVREIRRFEEEIQMILDN